MPIAADHYTTVVRLAFAIRLYVDGRLTSAQIAPKIGFTTSAIVKALNRAGVKMRPQVARG
jgi:AraC-like DNA-binding protein